MSESFFSSVAVFKSLNYQFKVSKQKGSDTRTEWLPLLACEECISFEKVNNAHRLKV